MIERAWAKPAHSRLRGRRQFRQNDPRDDRHVELRRLVERRPDELDEFGFGMDDVRRAMGDQRGVGDKKSGVETSGPPRRRDRARDEIETVERWKDAGGGKARPGARRRFCRRAMIRDAEARPVSSKVSRIAASASARAKPGEGRLVRALSFSSTIASSGPAMAHLPIAGFDPSAGEDEFAGHEFVRRHGAARARPAAPRRNDRCRISVAASRGRTLGDLRGAPRSAALRVNSEGIGAVHGASFSGPPNPCMRSAH